ncbi:proteasome assembly chaperone family protein [Salinibaculum rarum]|uniref:proteasome assembly chaperone family protein n=1 Tax=Salinibaculum rarum TaxID=3058903 RepID=UPI00266042C7|nr:PAC2 family protein [Salinibaculum sp. KK48]
MAHIEEKQSMSLDDPALVEGLPGVGLVGKLAADHLVEQLEMEYYAACHCEGLPDVAVYEEGERGVRPPVRVYADEQRDLLVLQSDIPVSPTAAEEFAACVTGWMDDKNALPLYLSGLPEEKDGVPLLYGIATGGADALLAEHDIPVPSESGMVSGPTGALLAEAGEQGLDSVGLVVQADANFPDPEAARVFLNDGIGPLAGIDVATDRLVEQADKVAAARERLAKQMQEAEEESTRAQPLGMYQ